MKDTEINGYRILSMFNMFKEMKATKRTKEEKNHQKSSGRFEKETTEPLEMKKYNN